MDNRKKHFTLMLIVLSILLLVTACDSARTRPRFYDLNLEVAGEGAIRESGGQIITATENTITLSRNSTIKIEAEPFSDSDFLFWTGDVGDEIISLEQSIFMNRDKEVISVFGNPDEIFMAGYLTESWGTTDIIGYWKALTDYPNLEIYLRRTIDSKQAYRYIFDEGEPEDGRIVYYQPDLANSKYIAAMIRIEESNLLEFGKESKYLFVYIDIMGFHALVEKYSDTIDNIYRDLIDDSEYNNEEFLEEVNKLIHEYRDKDVILGNTVNIIDHNF